MPQVTLIMTASLDGYVVKPDGMAVGAMPEPPALKRWKLDRISRADVHIMGRVVYQEMETVWPKSKDPYAAAMNDIPKVVFSKTLKAANWPESTIASGDLANEIASLRRRHSGEIIAWGGASFAQSLVRADLIDEFAIITNPVVYGGGTPLFVDLPKALELDMLASTSFSSGHLLRLFTRRNQ